MKKFAILGYPLGHSLSPQIYSNAFGLLGINAEYGKVEIPPDKFDVIIAQLKKDDDYDGFNITIPYKQNIIPFLDDIDQVAAAIGAVNTIVCHEKKWKGYNTDVDGFISPLKRLHQPIENCLVIGNGGAARAVIYGLTHYLGIRKITLAVRNIQKAKDLCEAIRSIMPETELIPLKINNITEQLAEYDLLVNTTPVGTAPHVNETPLPDLKSLKSEAIVYDLVYNPSRTKLLSDAEKAGKNIIIFNGTKMLLGQAVKAFKLWTGQDMPADDIRRNFF